MAYKKIVNTGDITHEEWLGVRRNLGIGGSEMAAVMGYNKWASALDIWLDKRGQKEPVEHFSRIWESNGIGWLTENIGPCRHTTGYSNIFAYHGSSVYDTDEMRRLIDCLIDEAMQIGVETKQVNEVNSLLDEWGKDEQAKKA